MAGDSVGGVLDVDRLVTVIEDFNTVFIRLASVQKLNFSALSVLHSLSRGGPMRLTAPVSQAYTSVTFYTRRGVAYYGINDRAAGRRAIELYLMTTPQHEAMPEEADVTAADRLIIESPSTTGLIVLRALSPEPGLMPMAQASVAAARCVTQTQ